MSTTASELKLNVKIICLTGVQYDQIVHSVTVNLRDGLMQIFKNYSSVIEEVIAGKIKIYETNSKDSPVFFNVSEGWIVTSQNNCHIYVSTANKI